MQGLNRILVIAPHVDDDVLGCGGVMSRLSEGSAEVFVSVMTSGNAGDPELFPIEGTLKGRREAKESHAVLGVKETYFFDFPAPRLDTYPSYKISIAIEEQIRDLGVDTIFVPHRGDIHKDHRVIFEAALVAARPVKNIPVRRIFTYETLSETEWSPPYGDAVFCPNVFVEISEKNLEAKVEAFLCYSPPRRQESPHPRSIDGIKNLARFRGAAITSPYAEAFGLIREVRNLSIK